MATEVPSPAGIDVPAVTEWLGRRVADLNPPLLFTRSSVGRSNLTYVIEDDLGGRWVLRRPPLSGLLPSAHDMAREHRIISALGGCGYRVTAVVGFESDPAIPRWD